MSQKHFIRIAATLAKLVSDYKATNDGVATTVLDEVAHALASDFADFNPNFDRARFLRACGLSEV